MVVSSAFIILLAEDSGSDVLLFRDAVKKCSEKLGVKIHIEAVPDGAEAIAYLGGEGKFGDRKQFPFPDIVVLDLKMPRLTGLDVLAWLKGHDEYRRLPKILFSGSSEERDIDEAYRLGVNTYFQKPGSLDEFRELVHYIICYWVHTQRPVIRHVSPVRTVQGSM